jgi:hypothetical protein
MPRFQLAQELRRVSLGGSVPSNVCIRFSLSFAIPPPCGTPYGVPRPLPGPLDHRLPLLSPVRPTNINAISSMPTLARTSQLCFWREWKHILEFLWQGLGREWGSSHKAPSVSLSALLLHCGIPRSDNTSRQCPNFYINSMMVGRYHTTCFYTVLYKHLRARSFWMRSCS